DGVQRGLADGGDGLGHQGNRESLGCYGSGMAEPVTIAPVFSAGQTSARALPRLPRTRRTDAQYLGNSAPAPASRYIQNHADNSLSVPGVLARRAALRLRPLLHLVLWRG